MEITIKIDTRTKEGVKFIDFIRTLSFVKIAKEKKPSKNLLNAMNDYKKGKVKKITGKDKLSKHLTNV